MGYLEVLMVCLEVHPPPEERHAQGYEEGREVGGKGEER